MYAARNLAKAWLLLVGVSAVFAAFGWTLTGYRLAFEAGTFRGLD